MPLSPYHQLTHTTSVLVPILRMAVRMAMHVPPVMSFGLSAGIAEVAAMSNSSFCKRFRSSYDSSSSSTFLVRKRYRGTSELILSTDSEENEEVVKSLDSDSESKDVEDEGPTIEDEDSAKSDEGLAAGVEGLVVDDERTAVSDPLGLGYRALRHRELALEEDHVYSTFETDPENSLICIDVHVYPPPAPPVQTPPSLDWTSGSLPISLSQSDVPSLVSSPMIPLIIPSPIATSTATILVDEDQFIEQIALQQELQEMRDHVTVLE
uniref:Uncharacterized protein n=1 Tax=Tanacetum cinerariifolium TaxID=118510 RepID=A0A6L2MXN8_TANCI|nr:hypothetical protein [Tanacetum cinerariifolium]